MIYSTSIWSLVIVFVLGAIIGSFLNVVILRIHTGRKITGRSSCASCAKELSFSELIPILSYFLLRGRCKECKSKISIQYPLVEFLTGTLFVAFFYHFLNSALYLKNGLIPLIFLFILSSIFVVISVYDIKHTIIPDEWSVFLSITVVGFLFFSGGLNLIKENILPAFLIALFFFAFWYFSNGKWMGLGDSKLSFGIGLWLGSAQGVNAVVIAFWVGAAISLFALFLKRFSLSKKLSSITIKSEVPFGPFLIIGALIAYFFEPVLFSQIFTL